MDERCYMTFIKEFQTDLAIKLFVKKYGRPPERIFIDKGLLKLGPEPAKEVEAKHAT